MQYRTLGRTGIHVSPYALGTLMFATTMGNDPADSARIIHKALDAGINVVDTADAYAGQVGDLLRRGVHTGGGEYGLRGLDQRADIALRVGAAPARRRVRVHSHHLRLLNGKIFRMVPE